MKILGAAVAGLVLALVPGGAAFAGEAYGNCGLNSAGGHAERVGLAGKGHGGMVELSRGKEGCAAKVVVITNPVVEVPAPDGISDF